MEEDWKDLIQKFRKLEIKEQKEDRPQVNDCSKERQLEIKGSQQQEFCKWYKENFNENFYRPKEYLEEWNNEYTIQQITLFRFRELSEEVFIPVDGGPSNLLRVVNSLERNENFKLILWKLGKESSLKTINLFSWRSAGIVFILYDEYVRGKKYVSTLKEGLYVTSDEWKVFGEKHKKKIYAKEVLKNIKEALSLFNPIQKATNEHSIRWRILMSLRYTYFQNKDINLKENVYTKNEKVYLYKMLYVRAPYENFPKHRIYNL